MNAIVFGASGMVGSDLLHLLLDDGRLENVYAVCRSPLDHSSSKLTQVIHNDYQDFSDLRDYLSKSDICFYCLGVYQSQVSKDDFWKITVEFLRALLEELSKTNNTLTFCLFSAQGANPEGKSVFRSGNAKGEAENLLSESKIKNKYIFRPGFINPGRKSAMAGFSLYVYKFLYKLIPSIGIDSADLAKAMIKIGTTQGKRYIFENRDIRRLVHET